MRIRLLTCLLCLSGCGARPASFVRKVSWAENGVWLEADTHTHTKFSDGDHTVAEVIAHAEQFGCDAVAITDHAHLEYRATRAEYFQELDAAQKEHPKLIVLAGLEWNLPPWLGEEHATVLTHPAAVPLLARFAQTFDGAAATAARVGDGLRFLDTEATRDSVRPVVIYNHPGRKASDTRVLVERLAEWRAASDVVIGFEGAPGHQNAAEIGSYKGSVKTIERWDPGAAEVGGAWDELLGQGFDVWAALAPSDFHNADPGDLNDPWPCQFAVTAIYAPNKSAVGLLQALRAGTFIGVHGHIVERAMLEVRAPGLGRAAIAGEVIRVAPGTDIEVNLALPAESTADQFELIAVDKAGARILSGSKQARLRVAEGGVVVRARGWHQPATGSRLSFYTNPIRIVTSGR